MDDKLRVTLGFAVSVMVFLGVFAYAMAVINYGTVDLSEVLLVMMAVVLAIGAIVVLKDKMKNVKSGLPAEDEMSQKSEHKAGYYAYLSSVWIALGTSWIGDIIQITVSQTVGIVILLPAMIFIGLMIYYRKKGV